MKKIMIRTIRSLTASILLYWLVPNLVFAQKASRAKNSIDAIQAYPNPLNFSYIDINGKLNKELRDPCIIREGNTYYLVFTMYPFSGSEYRDMDKPFQGGSPGISIYSSKDLKSWKFENWLVQSAELPENSPYKNRFWAPEIHKMNGRFFLIFTADNWIKPEYNPAGNWRPAGFAFVGVADKITGPYKHISYIKGGACDTSLFADTDGRTYAVIPRGGMGIHIQQIDLTRIDEDQVELLGQPALIMAPSNKDIGVETNPKTVEGPWLEKINGRYYLFHAAYYTDQAPPEWEGYWVNVAVADAVGGPYKKDPRGKLFLGGHAAIFNGPKGVKYFSYRNEVNGSPEHRKLSIDPFIIDSNGQVQTPAPAQQIKR